MSIIEFYVLVATVLTHFKSPGYDMFKYNFKSNITGDSYFKLRPHLKQTYTALHTKFKQSGIPEDQWTLVVAAGCLLPMPANSVYHLHVHFDEVSKKANTMLAQIQQMAGVFDVNMKMLVLSQYELDRSRGFPHPASQSMNNMLTFTNHHLKNHTKPELAIQIANGCFSELSFAILCQLYEGHYFKDKYLENKDRLAFILGQYRVEYMIKFSPFLQIHNKPKYIKILKDAFELYRDKVGAHFNSNTQKQT